MTDCPLCASAGWTYLFTRHTLNVQRCSGCGLTRVDPQPTDEDIEGFYAAQGKPSGAWRHRFAGNSLTELDAAAKYLETLRTLHVPDDGMLLIAPLEHPFARLAAQRGYRIETSLQIRELGNANLQDGRYTSAVVIFQLETSGHPLAELDRIHAALRPGAALLLVTPSLDSWSARLLRDRWTEWRPEHPYYFDRQTIQSALLRSSFAGICLRSDRRRFSLQHLYDRARSSPQSRLTRLVQVAYRLAPAPIRERARVTLSASGMVVTARRAERRPRPLLSIVMPVFNERDTFAKTMERVLAKDVPGIDKEIIVVESNSTDGTRELVTSFVGRPGVNVILEEQPRGKGHAVRTGFDAATGDYILIQDADCEYDVDDYDALIGPLKSFRQAFVLGSRHIGDWKIRRFNDQMRMAAFFNLGHWIFAGLLNAVYGQRMKDPFTMYKVFRRDCLHGLRFECNRFDFDFELVIKLVRKGYVPKEIPVNYEARSFTAGKKVAPFRDPLTWLHALIKFRFTSLYEDEA